MTAKPPMIKLIDGVVLPQLGLGVWQVSEGDAERVVRQALAVGYRSIDTAAAYENEVGVGAGLAGSDVAREDVFITTKLSNRDHGYRPALAACRASLERLGLEYVDLYLVHWPLPWREDFIETWAALLTLKKDGLARSIGVSNFTEAHLDRIIQATGVVPSVNQIELHPFLQQAGQRAAHHRRGITTEAWSPLAQGRVMREPSLVRIAEDQGRTPAQIVLRWHLQLGNVVIPKSGNPSRLRENFDVFQFQLTDEQMQAISALEKGMRLGPHPDYRRPSTAGKG